MRILIVHNSYQIHGGEDAVVSDEAELLRENGIDCHLFTVTNDTIRSFAARVGTAINLVYSFRAKRALSQKIRECRPDIVHVHNFFPLLTPSIFDACRSAGVPSVLTLHNFRLLCPSAFLYDDELYRERSLHRSCWWTVPKRVYRNSLTATFALAAMVECHKRFGTWDNKVDRFIALSEWAQAKFIEGGLPSDRIVVKPNAVRRPVGAAAPDRSGALFVGRLDNQKGIKILLEAWNQVDYPIRVIGDGPLAPLVQKASGNVVYLGRRPRDVVTAEMQKARFLVVPSIGHEMFPLTIVEAFAAGLPVLCSDLPSLRSLVAEGETGFTFASNDPTALAATARWAIAHQDALDEAAGRASQVYAERYSPDANLKALMDVYRSAATAFALRHAPLPTGETTARPLAAP